MTIAGLLKNLNNESITVEGALVLMALATKKETGMTVLQLSKATGVPEEEIRDRARNLPVMVAKKLVACMPRGRYISRRSYRLTENGVELMRRLMTADPTAKSPKTETATK